jgi:hypothetical protein
VFHAFVYEHLRKLIFTSNLHIDCPTMSFAANQPPSLKSPATPSADRPESRLKSGRLSSLKGNDLEGIGRKSPTFVSERTYTAFATVCPSWENYILSRVEEPLKEVLAIRTPSLLVTNDRLQETMFPFHSLYSHLLLIIPLISSNLF